MAQARYVSTTVLMRVLCTLLCVSMYDSTSKRNSKESKVFLYNKDEIESTFCKDSEIVHKVL